MRGRGLGPGGNGNGGLRFLRSNTYTMDETKEAMKRPKGVKGISMGAKEDITRTVQSKCLLALIGLHQTRDRPYKEGCANKVMILKHHHSSYNAAANAMASTWSGQGIPTICQQKASFPGSR
jgi:hypothetical protein